MVKILPKIEKSIKRGMGGEARLSKRRGKRYIGR
jgi:hypothetical protein